MNYHVEINKIVIVLVLININNSLIHIYIFWAYLLITGLKDFDILYKHLVNICNIHYLFMIKYIFYILSCGGLKYTILHFPWKWNDFLKMFTK